MLTITEAAEATGRSRRTIGRMLDAGQLEDVHREGDGGSWRIPVEALLAAGLALHAPEQPEPAPPTPARPSPVGTPTDDVELRAELAEWQRRAEVAEAVAAERADALDDLRTALALAQRMLGTSAPADLPTPTPEQRPGSSKSEPMLVTPEQESADADTLVVAEFDQATRSVADLTEATLTGHTRRWRRSPKSGSEPMLVAPEQESGDADDLVVSELDQATRSVADLRDLLLDRSSPIGDRFSGGRDLGIEPEPMLVNPEQRPGSSKSEPMLVTDTDARWGREPDSPTSQRPTITSRLRAKLRGF